MYLPEAGPRRWLVITVGIGVGYRGWSAALVIHDQGGQPEPQQKVIGCRASWWAKSNWHFCLSLLAVGWLHLCSLQIQITGLLISLFTCTT